MTAALFCECTHSSHEDREWSTLPRRCNDRSPRHCFGAVIPAAVSFATRTDFDGSDMTVCWACHQDHPNAAVPQ